MGFINWEALARRIYGHRKRDTNTGSETGTSAQAFGVALASVQAGEIVPIALTGVHSVRIAYDAGIDTSVEKPTLVPVAQEIIAWRGWQLGKDKTGTPQLLSFRGTPWDGPSLVADVVPNWDNTNGIYALLPDNSHRGDYERTCAVWGTVALSGIVVEGEMGYRGERATIRTLKVVRHPEELRDAIMLEITAALEDRYQCTVELDADRIWHNTPDEELVPANPAFYSGSTSYVLAPYQSFGTQVVYSSGGRRRR